MKNIGMMVAALFLVTMLFAGIASAHVVVYPQETTQNTYEKFTVRVPTEKDVPTVKVEVKIPAEVNVSRFEPVAGWKYDITKDTTGKITSVTWTATGDGLSSTEFGEFNMQGKVSDKATSLEWKAIQTYKDGSVVEWVGAKGSDHPASVTAVHTKSADTSTAPQGTTDNSKTSLYVSIVALVVSLVSLVVSFARRKK
jgi:uncharacterized protein YcnI